MEELRVLFIVLGIVLRIIGAYVCSNKAEQLNRSSRGWGFFGFISPIFAMIWIQFMKPVMNWESSIDINKTEENINYTKQFSNSKTTPTENVSEDKKTNLDTEHLVPCCNNKQDSIMNLEIKLDILKKSHKEGLLTEKEFKSKTKDVYKLIEENQKTRKQQVNDEKEKYISKELIAKNRKIIDSLDELLNSGLIDKDEYEVKMTKILADARDEYDNEMAIRNPNTFKIKFDSISKSYGYIDSSGKVIISYRFDDAFPFQEGLAAVIYKGKRGYIDTSGYFVIKPIYDVNGTFFKNGEATVSFDGMEMKINQHGEVIK